MSVFDIQSPLPARKPNLESDDSSPLVLPEKKAVRAVVDEVVTNNIDSKAKEVNQKKGFPSWAIWAGIALVSLIILAVVLKWLLPSLAGKPPVVEQKLVYWGLWEAGPTISLAIEEFEKKNPGVKVVYTQMNKKDYRSKLQGRLSKSPDEAEVPDVFRIHSSWLPMFSSQLAAMPNEVANAVGMEVDFYKTFGELKVDGKYTAMPLMYDNLSLFYNKKMIESAQASLPKTWWGFEKLARKLTVKDSSGNISIAGAALGTAGNVDHWSDIVGLLLKQNGANPFVADAANKEKLQTILTYYTQFRSKDAVWDETMPNSTLAFANGKLALYFAPSWRVFDIEAINPSLEFEVTTVPQLPTLAGVDPAAIESGDASGNLTSFQWASYWVEGVSKNSKKQALAWEFLKFLATREELVAIHTAASQVRSFGPIYPRKSMKDMLTANKKITPFVSVADNANSWYLSSFTHDEGLNDGMIKYFEDAINGTLSNNGTVDTAMVESLSAGVLQLRDRYKLTVLP